MDYIYTVYIYKYRDSLCIIKVGSRHPINRDVHAFTHLYLAPSVKRFPRDLYSRLDSNRHIQARTAEPIRIQDGLRLSRLKIWFAALPTSVSTISSKVSLANRRERVELSNFHINNWKKKLFAQSNIWFGFFLTNPVDSDSVAPIHFYRTRYRSSWTATDIGAHRRS